MRTRLLPVDPTHPDPHAIAEAAKVLARGGLVAFPTETVYGLGANALNESAVEAVFRAKGRPPTDPLIVHVTDLDLLANIAQEIPDVVQELGHRFWPGPLTLILHKRAVVPDAVTAGLPTVGVRVPSHPIALALLRAGGVPVAAPSANRFSKPSPTSAEHVMADLDGLIDVVLDAGPTPIGIESTILDLTVSPPLVRRPGGVTLTELRRVLPETQSIANVLAVARTQSAPGQLQRHYAPRVPLTLYVGDVSKVAQRLAADARTSVASGLRVGILAPEEDLLALAPRLAAVATAGRVVTARYGSRENLSQAAHDLFRALREIDGADVNVILAVAPEDDELGAAIVDRLTRAAEGRVVRVKA
jgi:L-threonylcarbamoyladenylate synthase